MPRHANTAYAAQLGARKARKPKTVRSGKTKAAPKRRNRSRRAKAAKTRALPIGSSSIPIRGKAGAASSTSLRSARSGNSLRVSGHEYLGPVSVPTGEAAETIYYQRLNTAGPLNTRLQQIADIFERWRPHVYRYRFVPSRPTTTPGTLIFAQDPDVLSQWSSGAAGNSARLRALPGSIMRQSFQGAECNLSSFRDYTSLWTYDPVEETTSDGDRLDIAGQFLIGCAAPTGLASGTVLGTIELEYDIEFFIPKISNSASNRTTEFVISGAAATTVKTAVNAGRGVIDTIVDEIKRAPIMSAELGGASAAIRQYVKMQYSTPDPPVESKDSKDVKVETTKVGAPIYGSGGWLSGQYYIEVFLLNATATAVNAGTVTRHDYGCTFIDTTLLLPDKVYNMYAASPIGSFTYPEGIRFQCDFGTGTKTTRGFADWSYTNGACDTIIFRVTTGAPSLAFIVNDWGDAKACTTLKKAQVASKPGVPTPWGDVASDDEELFERTRPAASPPKVESAFSSHAPQPPTPTTKTSRK